MRAVHKGKIARRPEPNINIQYLYIKCELSVLLSFCHSRRNPDIVLVVLALSLFERAQDVRMYGVVPWWNGAWSGMLERERDLSRTRRVRCEVAMARSASQPSKPVDVCNLVIQHGNPTGESDMSIQLDDPTW